MVHTECLAQSLAQSQCKQNLIYSLSLMLGLKFRAGHFKPNLCVPSPLVPSYWLLGPGQNPALLPPNQVACQEKDGEWHSLHSLIPLCPFTNSRRAEQREDPRLQAPYPSAPGTLIPWGCKSTPQADSITVQMLVTAMILPARRSRKVGISAKLGQ